MGVDANNIENTISEALPLGKQVKLDFNSSHSTTKFITSFFLFFLKSFLKNL